MVFILARSISCKPSFSWILFHSSPHYLKSLSKYLPHAPFLLRFSSVSLGCFCSVVLCVPMFSQLAPQLSVSRSSPPSLLLLLGCFTCTMYRYLFWAPCGRTPVHPAPSLRCLPSASWTEHWVCKISRCREVKYVSLYFSLCWKSGRKQKRRKKQPRNKRGVSR